MKKGFTFIEILIIIAVVLVLMVFTANGFSKLRDGQTLNSAVEQINSLIDEARFKTAGSKNNLKYGIHFETSRVVLFEGDTFSEPNTANKEQVLPGLVEISLISLNGGGADLVFKKLTGETDQYGTITIRLKNDTSKSKNISIKASGAVNVEI